MASIRRGTLPIHRVMSPSRSHSLNPARWLAGAAGAIGAVCLVALLMAEQVEITRVSIATSLFFVGTILFIRSSMSPARWERTVNGPEARRFLAICLGITVLMLMAGAVLLVGWVYRSAGQS